MNNLLIKARVSETFKKRLVEYCMNKGLSESEVIRKAVECTLSPHIVYAKAIDPELLKKQLAGDFMSIIYPSTDTEPNDFDIAMLDNLTIKEK